jgi:hypothetical protein
MLTEPKVRDVPEHTWDMVALPQHLYFYLVGGSYRSKGARGKALMPGLSHKCEGSRLTS